jgi:hypothetical protein
MVDDNLRYSILSIAKPLLIVQGGDNHNVILTVTNYNGNMANCTAVVTIRSTTINGGRYQVIVFFGRNKGPDGTV